MSDLQGMLERAHAAAVDTARDGDGYENFLRYRDRRRRNQKLAAGAVALAFVLALGGVAASIIRAGGSTKNTGFAPPSTNIGDPCFAHDPCFDLDLYTIRVDGTDVVRLGYDEGRDLAYSWSPDGSRVAFANAVAIEGGGPLDARTDIYTMDADGGNVEQLTDDAAYDLFPVYSPDGSMIAFMRVVDENNSEIWVMNVDGSSLGRVTSFENGGLDNFHAAWSPDGERIAFVRGHVPPGSEGRLWVVDVDGANAQAVADAPLMGFPSWSPDGLWIAFETGEWPEPRVGLFNLASDEVVDLGSGFHPVWSPDGSRLLVSLPEGGFALADPFDRSAGRVIVNESGWGAAWSPDGEQILFTDAGLTWRAG